MMKKEYINPTMEVVELKTVCSILAGSGEGVANGSKVGDTYDDDTPNDVTY